MTDELKHECAVAMVVLRKSAVAIGDFGGTKLSLLLEKQHNRGQDGAGAAILSANPEPGETPYWIAKSASATPLADVLGMLTKRCKVQTGLTGLTGLSGSTAPGTKNPVNLVNPVKTRFERIFLGHLRYATFGKNDVAFCHPFVHESSELKHTLLLAGNFNLTNAHELFDDYRHRGSFPTSKSDGYLICEMIAQALKNISRVEHVEHVELEPNLHDSTCSAWSESALSRAISTALKNADGAWTLCGMTADGWAFATRDPHGIRPGWHYIDDDVVVVASERAAIQAAFDVPPEAVKELPPGEALVVSPEGEVKFVDLNRAEHVERVESNTSDLHVSTCSTRLEKPLARPCSFERIYFSRANDADIHRERKALGAALVPRILEAANAPMDSIFFSYIPNSARIAFHGLLEDLFKRCVSPQSRVNNIPRFGEVAVKDAKFRTFIADAAARREFYKHVYDVTYGLVKKDDTLVVLDDSIVRGNTMKNAILPMLDRLGPKRIVIASSAPPIRYPDCYGIDMSTLGELVAFKALVNLLDGERGTYPPSEASAEGGSMRGGNGERELREALAEIEHLHVSTCSTRLKSLNPLASLYARFTEKQHAAEIARLLTPPGMKAEVVVVYQTIEDLHKSLAPVPGSRFPVPRIGDWYFTGDYPTPGGYKVLRKALLNYLDKRNDRSY